MPSHTPSLSRRAFLRTSVAVGTVGTASGCLSTEPELTNETRFTLTDADLLTSGVGLVGEKTEDAYATTIESGSDYRRLVHDDAWPAGADSSTFGDTDFTSEFLVVVEASTGEDATVEIAGPETVADDWYYDVVFDPNESPETSPMLRYLVQHWRGRPPTRLLEPDIQYRDCRPKYTSC